MIRSSRIPELNEESEHAWSLSFGDLMSLLMAVFVLIAAMSDLREGEQFDSVSRSVRAAFGFTVAASPQEAPDTASLPPLLARFEAMGLAAHKPMLAMDEAPGLAECCSIRQDGERIVVRLTGDAVFESDSATLQAAGQSLVEWLATYLQPAALPLEIRGICGTEPLPEHASYADGRDLAYARARQVADLLAERGIQDNRMIVSLFGANSPLDSRGDDEVAPLVEIIVHALPTATHDFGIAGYSGS
jgi:flagellar motor protein MotB